MRKLLSSKKKLNKLQKKNIIENFYNYVSFATKSNCTTEAATLYEKPAMKITSTVAGGGGTFSTTKTGLSLNLSTMRNVSIMLECSNILDVNRVQIHFFTDASNYYYFTRYATRFVPGRNTISFAITDALSSGSPSWSNITRIRVTGYGGTGKNPYIIVSDLRKDSEEIQSFVWTADEGYLGQYNAYNTYFEPNGIPLTIFVRTDKINDTANGYMTTAQLQTLKAKGVCFGIHIDHSDMGLLTDAECETKITDSVAIMKSISLLSDTDPIFLAYPFPYTGFETDNARMSAICERAGVALARCVTSQAVSNRATNRYALAAKAANETLGLSNLQADLASITARNKSMLCYSHDMLNGGTAPNISLTKVAAFVAELTASTSVRKETLLQFWNRLI